MFDKGPATNCQVRNSERNSVSVMSRRREDLKLQSQPVRQVPSPCARMKEEILDVSFWPADLLGMLFFFIFVCSNVRGPTA